MQIHLTKPKGWCLGRRTRRTLDAQEESDVHSIKIDRECCESIPGRQIRSEEAAKGGGVERRVASPNIFSPSDGDCVRRREAAVRGGVDTEVIESWVVMDDV